MTNILKSFGRYLASNLNPVEQGMHYHPGPAGPYACRDRHCVSRRTDHTDA